MGTDISTGDHARVPVHLELHLPPGHFGLLVLTDQQVKERLAVLAGLLDIGITGR